MKCHVVCLQSINKEICCFMKIKVFPSVPQTIEIMWMCARISLFHVKTNRMLFFRYGRSKAKWPDSCTPSGLSNGEKERIILSFNTWCETIVDFHCVSPYFSVDFMCFFFVSFKWNELFKRFMQFGNDFIWNFILSAIKMCFYFDWYDSYFDLFVYISILFFCIYNFL